MSVVETQSGSGADATQPMRFMEKVRLYVPIVEGLEATSEQIIEEVSDTLSKLYGGATVIPDVEGHWISDDSGEKIEDNIVLIESLSERVDIGDIQRLASYVKESLREESVLFEVEQTTAMFV